MQLSHCSWFYFSDSLYDTGMIPCPVWPAHHFEIKDSVSLTVGSLEGVVY